MSEQDKVQPRKSEPKQQETVEDLPPDTVEQDDAGQVAGGYPPIRKSMQGPPI